MQTHTHNTRNNTLNEVWIHPETLALLDGAVLPDAPLSGQEPPVVVIWSLDKSNNSRSAAQTASSESDSVFAPK